MVKGRWAKTIASDAPNALGECARSASATPPWIARASDFERPHRRAASIAAAVQDASRASEQSAQDFNVVCRVLAADKNVRAPAHGPFA